MLRFCCGWVIFRWKSTSSVIIHYYLTELRWCLCLISSSWGEFRGDRCFVFNMTAVQLEKSQELTWRDEWCWQRNLNPVRKVGFSACGDKRQLKKNIKVKEHFCGTAEPGGFRCLHKGLGRVPKLVVANVVLWVHYHRSPVNCSRHQSTSASLLRSYCLNVLK